MNPFISFCLYVAARIFIHAYKKSSEDQANFTNLEFLLNAMQTIKKKNPLTESFLIQLMVDLEGTGIDNALKASGNHASRVALQKIYVSGKFFSCRKLKTVANAKIIRLKFAVKKKAT